MLIFAFTCKCMKILEMQQLNLPTYKAKITKNGSELKIFDVLRHKYVALTPEEWVRQNFIHFLVNYKGYNPTLMANEVGICLNGVKKRCDSVLYTKGLVPRLIIEYKRPDVEITQKVFDQICRYNMVLRVDYLIVSNGISHYCCKMDYEKQQYVFLEDIPDYKDL